MAASLPLLAYRTSLRLTADPQLAMQAGVIAAFPGFYLPFNVTVDAFVLYAVLGTLTFWLIATERGGGSAGRWFAAGMAGGLAALARADGMLLIAVAGFAAIRGDGRRWVRLGLLLGGSLLFAGPWWARNLSVAGALVNPGSSGLLWMTSYDDLFSYPADLLEPGRWLQAGLGPLLSARWDALRWNAARLIAENGLVFLGPFMLIGAWKHRAQPIIRLTFVYLGLLLILMTIVFPFIGPRGAVFHSSTAAMPVLIALAPAGLREAIEWAGRRRGWNLAQARTVLGGAAVMLAIALTGGMFILRVVRPAGSGQGWGAGAATYRAIGDQLTGDLARVAVNNPPGFSLVTGREAVVIPNGAPSTLEHVVERYAVGWVVLESNHPAGLDGLYGDPGSLAWLRLTGTLTDPTGNPVYLLQVVGR
jgi:hypothetical protein